MADKFAGTRTEVTIHRTTDKYVVIQTPDRKFEIILTAEQAIVWGQELHEQGMKIWDEAQQEVMKRLPAKSYAPVIGQH